MVFHRPSVFLLASNQGVGLSCQQPPPRGTITRGASARSRASATTMPQSSTGTAQPISTTPLSPAVAAAATTFASRHTSHPPSATAPLSATRNARGVNGGSRGTTTTPRVVRREMTSGDWSSSKLRSMRRAELMMLVCRPRNCLQNGSTWSAALRAAVCCSRAARRDALQEVRRPAPTAFPGAQANRRLAEATALPPRHRRCDGRTSVLARPAVRGPNL